MKALTLTQPWATLVAIEAKHIETRSWSTNYRGPLAIHAAASKYVDDYLLMKIEPFYSCLRAAGIESRLQIPLGGIIAICELIGVDQFGYWVNDRKPMRWAKGKYYFELTEQERAFGDFSIGRFGWFLANVKLLPEPIPAKGALGLWEWQQS